MTKKVAIIDDNRIFRLGTVAQVDGLDGYEGVDVSPNRLDLIPSDVRVFLVDNRMPNFPFGPELIKKLKPLYPGAVFIGWSNDDDLLLQAAFKEAGAVAFVRKNISREELMSLLNQNT
ncbi:response regulator [Patescibacteria group bacterium]